MTILVTEDGQQIVPSNDVDTLVYAVDPEQTQVDPDGVSIVVQTISDTHPRGDFVFSHGELSGLIDDDHPQYLTSTRGNGLYTSISHSSLTGNVHGLAASELPGLGAWATEIDAVDKAFIETQMEADAIPSTRIESVVAGKIAAGTMSAKVALAEVFTASVAGSILNDDLTGISIGDPRIDMGYVADTLNTYVIRHHNGFADDNGSYQCNFYIDAAGSAYLAGQVVIAGGSGIANLSDAGALATKDDISYSQTEEPATAIVGDLWYDTDDFILYRCSGTGPLTWTVVSNSFSLTSQLSDDADLGLTAEWGSVVDDGGKPDDGADVTVGALEATTTITNGGITLSGGGVIRAGKTSPSDTFLGFWLGWDGVTDYDFHIGDASNSLWWDGSANTLKIKGTIEASSFITGTTGQRIEINPSNDHELHFWGDRGTGTVAEILRIALPAGTDALGILQLGDTLTTRTLLSLEGEDNNLLRIYHSGTQSAIRVDTDGTGLDIDSTGTANGLVSTSTSGIGVVGSGGSRGVWGSSVLYGVYGSGDDCGVRGLATATDAFGVYGDGSSLGVGVYGTTTKTNGYGIQGVVGIAGEAGVYGVATNKQGVSGLSTWESGVKGVSTNKYGVYGIGSDATFGYGVRGEGGAVGVYGSGEDGGVFVGTEVGVKVVKGVSLFKDSPTGSTDGNYGHVYVNNDKLVIKYYDAGTWRYKYLTLTGTGVTWVHTTTAP